MWCCIVELTRLVVDDLLLLLLLWYLLEICSKWCHILLWVWCLLLHDFDHLVGYWNEEFLPLAPCSMLPTDKGGKGGFCIAGAKSSCQIIHLGSKLCWTKGYKRKVLANFLDATDKFFHCYDRVYKCCVVNWSDLL